VVAATVATAAKLARFTAESRTESAAALVALFAKRIRRDIGENQARYWRDHRRGSMVGNKPHLSPSRPGCAGFTWLTSGGACTLSQPAPQKRHLAGSPFPRKHRPQARQPPPAL